MMLQLLDIGVGISQALLSQNEGVMSSLKRRDKSNKSGYLN